MRIEDDLRRKGCVKIKKTNKELELNCKRWEIQELFHIFSSR